MTRPRRIDGLEITESDDGYVVYDRARDRVHFMNHTAVFVLELCDGRHAAGDIARLVQRTYSLDRAPERETRDLLSRLLDEGLTTGDAAAPGPAA
jgi:hypothetical protein